MKVSRSGYYAWLNRSVSAREIETRQLTARIHYIFHHSQGTYGSPRVHQALKQDGFHTGKKRVERIMRALGLRGRMVRVTKRMPNYKGFIARGENRRLTKPEPTSIDRVWVSDITYLKVKDSYKYLIAIMDVYSRRIISWSLTNTRTNQDTLSVLKRAIKKRRPEKGLIFHTDRGIEFTGHEFRRELEKHHILASVNRPGYCTDNSHMESYFHSLKIELIRGRTFNNMEELRYALKHYINNFYNKKRLHSGIGYMPPVEYEKLAA